MIEEPCADVTSIEEMESQKSVSNLWMSAYPLQAKGWKRAGRASLVGHGGSSDGGSIASKRGYGARDVREHASRVIYMEKINAESLVWKGKLLRPIGFGLP